MPEELLDDFEVSAAGEGEGGGSVSEVVEPDGWELRREGKSLEAVAQERGMDVAAVFTGEDADRVRPCWVPAVAFAVLLAAPPAQDGDGDGVEGDVADAVGFRGVAGHLPAVEDELPGDVQHAVV